MSYNGARIGWSHTRLFIAELKHLNRVPFVPVTFQSNSMPKKSLKILSKLLFAYILILKFLHHILSLMTTFGRPCLRTDETTYYACDHLK